VGGERGVTAVYRSWRYDVPRFDAPEEPVGLRRGPTGGVETIDDDDAIRQALLLLVSTRPGERVMRPEYGCYLHRLVFSPIDDTTAGLAIHYVRQAVERWEPRVEVLAVDAEIAAESATILNVVLEYRVRATLRTQTLLVPFDLRPDMAP
jgi:uncharacterized protein